MFIDDIYLSNNIQHPGVVPGCIRSSIPRHLTLCIMSYKLWAGRARGRGGCGGLAGNPAIWTMISSPAGVCLHTPLTCRPPPPGRPPRTRKQNSLIVSSPREQFAICPLFKHLQDWRLHWIIDLN